MNAREELTLTQIDSVLALPAEWDCLRRGEQVALDRRVLAAFEAARIDGVKTSYVMVYRGGRAVAGAAVHRVEIQLERQNMEWMRGVVRKAVEAGREDLLRFRAVVCGLNCSQGRDDVVSGDFPPSPEVVLTLACLAERIAFEEGLDGVVFSHLHLSRREPFDLLLDRGYVRLPSLGYASLKVDWKNLQDYVNRLRSGHRRQVLASLARMREAGMEAFGSLDLASHAEEFLRLYLAVIQRAEQRIETLNLAFFLELARACPRDVGLVGIKKDERLVAGALTMRAGDRLCCLEVGLDYALQEHSDLYLNLLLALVDRAAVTGASRLDLGQTALTAKANLGAGIDPTWIFVKPGSPLIHAALRVERPDLQPSSFPKRNVFRDSLESTRNVEPLGLDTFSAAGGDWARYVNPQLASYLALLRMDRVYVRGEGSRLWDIEQREVFDLAAGYGALPFGHNPGWLWEEVMELARRKVPNFVQGALGPEAGELAALLCRSAPKSIRYCVFANSGAEAVEVAIKAARAATGRPEIIVARGSFHGKTLGALSATSSQWYQEPFGAPAPGFLTVEYGSAFDLERVLEERSGRVAAFLVEPVQGEAGVILPPPGYLRSAAEICARHDVLLLVDEVQTGLGRLGSLFACLEEGIDPDALLISKALGGGIVPVAACLLSERAWSEKLAMRHSSTFAGNAFAATVGLAVVKRLLRDGGSIMRHVRETGALFHRRLQDTIAGSTAFSQVRGRGLLLALEIGKLEDCGSPILRSLALKRRLVPLICGYLLNVHGLRVMPPLSGRGSLRLIPPLNAPAEVFDKTCEAVADVAIRLDSGDLRGLTLYLRGDSSMPPPPQVRRHAAFRSSSGIGVTPTNGTFAFITTALDWESYRVMEPSLDGLPDMEVAACERLIRDTAEIPCLSEVTLRSRTGAICRGWFLGLPFTSRGLLSLRAGDSLMWVRRAVRLAGKLGAGIVGLGALTSVVTRGGMDVCGEGVGITTGNSYTVAAAMESIRLATGKLGIDTAGETCTVLGAAGSIGSVCAQLCAGMSKRVILVGRPDSRDPGGRLAKLADGIRRKSRCTIEIAKSGRIEEAVASARIVICATSSIDPILDISWLRPGAVVCDVARPPDVSPESRGRRDDILVLDGGVVSLPEPVSLGFNFGFEPGTAYACMAETISLAFDGWKGHYGLGPRGILSSFEDAAERADRHGFRVVGLRGFGRPVSEEEITRVRLGVRSSCLTAE